MKKRNTLLSNQEGFTLIEIIAVLVVLGILSAVAVPRFFDLQEDARNQAAQAAVAETRARLSQAYGQFLLRNGDTPANVQAVCNFVNDATILPANCRGVVNVGDDYVVNLARTNTQATITVSQVRGVALATNVTATWDLPN